MEDAKPMRLLLIEDDIGDAMKYTEIAKRRTDIKFVGMTDSCEEGLKLVKSRLPEGVILDLQLVEGKGTGLQFMEFLNTEKDLTLVPLVAVTTSNKSKSVFKRLEDLGVDWYFSKVSQDYDENIVVDTLLSLRLTLDAKQKKSAVAAARGGSRMAGELIESPDDRRARIYRRIEVELDLVGIRAKLKGRAYLRDAIYTQIHSDKDRGSGIEEVAAMHKLTYSSLVKTMQTAINDAWDNADPEELLTNFTARITAKNGVPYVSDFIHYYAEKISRSI